MSQQSLDICISLGLRNPSGAQAWQTCCLTPPKKTGRSSSITRPHCKSPSTSVNPQWVQVRVPPRRILSHRKRQPQVPAKGVARSPQCGSTSTQKASGTIRARGRTSDAGDSVGQILNVQSEFFMRAAVSYPLHCLKDPLHACCFVAQILTLCIGMCIFHMEWSSDVCSAC